MSPDADELCTFKMNALIECLTAILEGIEIILVGRALIYPPTKYTAPAVHYIMNLGYVFPTIPIS